LAFFLFYLDGRTKITPSAVTQMATADGPPRTGIAKTAAMTGTSTMMAGRASRPPSEQDNGSIKCEDRDHG
jgi:hypothetical protein